MIKVRPGIILIENNQVLSIRHNSATRNKHSFFRYPTDKSKQYFPATSGLYR